MSAEALVILKTNEGLPLVPPGDSLSSVQANTRKSSKPINPVYILFPVIVLFSSIFF
ncbi:hypothetical protein M129_4229 [Bacteroides fragilis str. S6R5]|nr:hypothetical protein M129_4229 [Bacteroides fragilis str. S6R5]